MRSTYSVIDKKAGVDIPKGKNTGVLHEMFGDVELGGNLYDRKSIQSDTHSGVENC